MEPVNAATLSPRRINSPFSYYILYVKLLLTQHMRTMKAPGKPWRLRFQTGKYGPPSAVFSANTGSWKLLYGATGATTYGKSSLTDNNILLYTPCRCLNIHRAGNTPYPQLSDMLHSIEKMPVAAFFRRFKPHNRLPHSRRTP